MFYSTPPTLTRALEDIDKAGPNPTRRRLLAAQVTGLGRRDSRPRTPKAQPAQSPAVRAWSVKVSTPFGVLALQASQR